MAFNIPKRALGKGSSSKKFFKIHRKTSAPEFLCNKVAGLEPATLFIS